MFEDFHAFLACKPQVVQVRLRRSQLLRGIGAKGYDAHFTDAVFFKDALWEDETTLQTLDQVIGAGAVYFANPVPAVYYRFREISLLPSASIAFFGLGGLG